MLKTVSNHLQIALDDLILLEVSIANQLRVQSSTNLQTEKTTISRRNSKDSKGRYLFMGLATLAGGAVIGLTAGLAAPLIGAGFTAALGAIGVTGLHIGSATGIALITTGGVLAGGGKLI